MRTILIGLVADRVAATCVTVDLEGGYSGRNLADVRAIADRRGRDYIAPAARRVRHRSAGPPLDKRSLLAETSSR